MSEICDICCAPEQRAYLGCEIAGYHICKDCASIETMRNFIGVRHADGSARIYCNDSNPCEEITPGNLRVKFDWGKGTSGFHIYNSAITILHRWSGRLGFAMRNANKLVKFLEEQSKYEFTLRDEMIRELVKGER